MKKLRLHALQFGAQDILSREQLKHVLGGDGSNTGSGSGSGTSCGRCITETAGYACVTSIFGGITGCYCPVPNGTCTAP